MQQNKSNMNRCACGVQASEQRHPHGQSAETGRVQPGAEGAWRSAPARRDFCRAIHRHESPCAFTCQNPRNDATTGCVCANRHQFRIIKYPPSPSAFPRPPAAYSGTPTVRRLAGELSPPAADTGVRARLPSARGVKLPSITPACDAEPPARIGKPRRNWSAPSTVGNVVGFGGGTRERHPRARCIPSTLDTDC